MIYARPPKFRWYVYWDDVRSKGGKFGQVLTFGGQVYFNFGQLYYDMDECVDEVMELSKDFRKSDEYRIRSYMHRFMADCESTYSEDE